MDPLSSCRSTEWVEGCYRETVRLLATQPGFGKGSVVALEELTVGLRTQAQSLTVARWKRVPGAFLEKVPGREVVKRNTECTDQLVRAVTAGKFELVGRPFFHRIVDIDRAVGWVGLRVYSQLFLVEITELRKFPLCADDIGRLNNWPGLVRISRRITRSLVFELPLTVTRLMRACRPS